MMCKNKITITDNEFAKSMDNYVDKIKDGDVDYIKITQNNEDKAVVMSIEEYERICSYTSHKDTPQKNQEIIIDSTKANKELLKRLASFLKISESEVFDNALDYYATMIYEKNVSDNLSHRGISMETKKQQ